jgi:hypothetical protein
MFKLAFLLGNVASLAFAHSALTHGEGDIHDPDNEDYFEGSVFANRCVGCIAYKAIYCPRVDSNGNAYATCEPEPSRCWTDGEDGQPKRQIPYKMFFYQCRDEAADAYDYETLTQNLSHLNNEEFLIDNNLASQPLAKMLYDLVFPPNSY